MIYIKYQSNSFPVIDRQQYIFWNIRLHFRLRVDLLSTKHAYGWTLGQQLIMPCWDPTLLSFQGAIHTKTHPPFQGSLLFKFTRLILFFIADNQQKIVTLFNRSFSFSFSRLGFSLFLFRSRFLRASASSCQQRDAVEAVSTQIYLLKLEIYILTTM